MARETIEEMAKPIVERLASTYRNPYTIEQGGEQYHFEGRLFYQEVETAIKPYRRQKCRWALCQEICDQLTEAGFHVHS